MALTPTLLHGGLGDDVAAVADALVTAGVTRLAVIGFSLGGALLLRLLGERGRVPGVFAGVAISPPLNPAAVQVHLDRAASFAYRRYFLAVMMGRLRRRARQFPAQLAGYELRGTTMRAYDEQITGPLAGFASADEYYRRADALPLVPAIATPTLLLHAQDDPLVPFAGFKIVGRSDAAGTIHVAGPYVRGEFPRHGGHLGFYDPTGDGDGQWADARALAFLEEAAG